MLLSPSWVQAGKRGCEISSGDINFMGHKSPRPRDALGFMSLEQSEEVS